MEHDPILGARLGDGSVRYTFDCDVPAPQIGLGIAQGMPLPRLHGMSMCGDGLHVFLVPMPRGDEPVSLECRCGSKGFEGKLRIEGRSGLLEMFVPESQCLREPAP